MLHSFQMKEAVDKEEFEEIFGRVLKKKTAPLKYIERRAQRERLAKLGKLPVEKKRGRR